MTTDLRCTYSASARFTPLWPAIIFALAALLLTGCKRSDDHRPGAAPNNADIDRLRALPYAGGTRADPDEDTGVIYRDADRSCPGYNIYAVQMLGLAELIDDDGEIVNTWHGPEGDRWERCTLLPDGDVIVIGAEGKMLDDNGPYPAIPDLARYIMRMNWDGDVLWKRSLLAHHDVEPTPDGRFLALTYIRRTMPKISKDIDVRVDQLTLLDAEGKVLESKGLLRAFMTAPQRVPLRRVGPSRLGGRPWIDLFHANSVEWLNSRELADPDPLYAPGNVLVSFRHQDRIAVINWDRDEVIWQWGVGEISGPHDATMLDNGHILLFDNGLGRNHSRALELDPLTERIVWQYQADPPTDFYTASKGSAQRLPNGNTLLAESDKGRAIEVTPDGEIVWEFICPHRVGDDQRAAIVRMVRHPREQIDAILREHQ